VTFDIGRTTLAAITLLEDGHRDAGRRIWEPARTGAANGSLMRTAPIGVAFATRPAQRRAAVFADSALTHFDPRCQLACAAFDAAIAAAIVGGAEPAAAARDELGEAAAALVGLYPDLGREIDTARHQLEDDLDRAAGDDPDIADPDGFVRVGFRLAFWELAHADGYRDGVIDVVNRGGDADTNGAIAGALLGAVHGVDAIPERWRRRVVDCRPDDPDLAGRFHPRTLLAALDRW
jgi:ADP-ribosyl-[dinitrogen reductase] hydrolase